MFDLKRAPRDVRREIRHVDRDGTRLALHVWRPEHPKAAVFYFHGLQSHAGWLWETGPRFAENDVAFYVLDRRGSGLSEGAREELADAETLLADYTSGVAEVRRAEGDDIPLGLFGHCLGGSFLAALMHHPEFTVPYDAAVFCSAWLGKLHATLSEEQRRALAADASDELWDAGLASSEFTADVRLQRFIDEDPLAVRRLTRRSRAVLLDLERRYLDPARPPLPQAASAFLSGHDDPIVDLDDAQKAFIQLTYGKGELTMLPTDRHYLLFTEARDRLIDWTSAFVLLSGVDHVG
ncbi:alpha/beta hydrolase [Streptomyces fractus]|uniref:alpha/beta hydrolase n=1 Tax=Streptomyces fractus TaxID=641806 RepID=UPI003CF1A6FE